MRRRRDFVLGTIVALLLAVPAGAAGAATPKQIYRDYADNGRLDGTYTQSELNAALQDAVLQGYGAPNVTAELGQEAGAAVGARGLLPFTGRDLSLMVLGGGGLLLLGFGLRRIARKST
jgi:hypothetical protein